MRINRSFLVAIGVALYALTAVPLALAQQTESRIVGRLLDESRSALPGVTVTVTSVETGQVRTTVTDTDGSFAVTNLSRGTYTVLCELPGFANVTRQVALGVGQNEAMELLMSVAGITEAVQVNAEASVIDTTSAKLGVNVSPEEIVNLPVNGRNFANLMTLAPGATSDGNGGWSSVRFNGKSNQQNYLNYDGVDGTYVFDASPGYLDATGSQFRLQTSMESVAEFRVNSGLAPAESGLGSGGNITVISKSGSNRFSGSLFEFLSQRLAGLRQQVRRHQAAARPEPVRRLDRRADRAQQDVRLPELRGPEADDRAHLHRGRPERRGPAAHHGRRACRQRRRPEPGPHHGGCTPSERVPAWHRGHVQRAGRAGHEDQSSGADRGLVLAARRPPLQQQPQRLRPLSVQRRRG